MAEHSELVSEMAILEKLGTQERLKMAKKRRLQQLKKWGQREKEFDNQSKKNKKTDFSDLGHDNDDKEDKKRRNENVHFVPSVMLLEAAARNDIDEVRRLLITGVNPDSANEDGLTALHQCCIDDSEEMMKLLIDFGANVNAKDQEQWTPLHAAATCGHLYLVKYLIEKGANLLAVNADNNMPYDICDHEETLDYIEQQMASRGITQQQIDETRSQTEMEMLDFLKKQLHNGVDLNSIKFGDCNASALHVAAANGYLQVVEFLLENNFNINIDDEDDWQPIHAAVCWGQPDVLEILAQAGANLDARTKNGETLFDICEDLELKEQIEKLKNEMENKQLLQQSLNGSRLKRSHSQNTRSQSVRRTSIREKRDTSRREAREEAKIRHHVDEDSTDNVTQQLQIQHNINSSSNSSISTHLNTNQKDTISLNSVTNVNNVNVSSYHQVKNQNSLNISLNNHTQESNHQLPELNLKNLQDNKKTNLLKESNQQFINSLNENEGNQMKMEIYFDHQSNEHNNQKSNNGLNNYLTNCSNVNTLSDLKRFRTDLRCRNHTNNIDSKDAILNNDLYNNKNVPRNVITKYDEQMVDCQSRHKFNNNQKKQNQNKSINLMNNCTMSNHNNNYLSPSPNSTLKKFRGDPSDMIGEMQKRKCCSMM